MPARVVEDLFKQLTRAPISRSVMPAPDCPIRCAYASADQADLCASRAVGSGAHGNSEIDGLKQLVAIGGCLLLVADLVSLWRRVRRVEGRS